MEHKIVFVSPGGMEVENPGEELLKEIIFKKGADYWDKDSTGDSALIRTQGVSRAVSFG